MLDIIVCEDNIKYRKVICDRIIALVNLQKIDGRIVLESSSYEEVLDSLRYFSANVFLLDIELQSNHTGIELAEVIRNKYEDAYIVFISEYRDLVFDSFKARPFSFLPKPFQDKELDIILIDIYKDMLFRNKLSISKSINIKIGHSIYHLQEDEIVYIEKIINKLIFHNIDKTIYCYESLESIITRLESNSFLRVHKSFIININFVSQIDFVKMEILFSDGQKCPLGGKYKNTIKSSFSNKKIKLFEDDEN